MIPEITDLKEINPELIRIINHYRERLDRWSWKLDELPVPVSDLSEINDLENQFNSCGRDLDQSRISTEGIFHFKTVRNLAAEGSVMSLFLPCLIEQWITESFWPDCLSDNHQPAVMIVDFMIGNKAVVQISNSHEEGKLILPKEELELTGTWSEVFNHLVVFTEKATQKLME